MKLDIMIPKKKTRVLFHQINFVYRMFNILIFAPLTLQFWDRGFYSYLITTYLTMQVGSLIYKKMYLPTYEILVYQHPTRTVMTPFHTWIMLSLILFISVLSGAILFFQGYGVFMSIFMPFFFFMGSVCWNSVAHTATSTLNNRDIEIHVVKKKEI